MGNLLRRGQRHRRISANVARSDNVQDLADARIVSEDPFERLPLRRSVDRGACRPAIEPRNYFQSGPHREDEDSKPITNEQEKSDLFIVAMKLANKPGRGGRGAGGANYLLGTFT